MCVSCTYLVEIPHVFLNRNEFADWCSGKAAKRFRKNLMQSQVVLSSELMHDKPRSKSKKILVGDVLQMLNYVDAPIAAEAIACAGLPRCLGSRRYVFAERAIPPKLSVRGPAVVVSTPDVEPSKRVAGRKHINQISSGWSNEQRTVLPSTSCIQERSGQESCGGEFTRTCVAVRGRPRPG